VPSLPGCISQGKTREEAITNIKEAIDGYIAALLEDSLRIPEEHFAIFSGFFQISGDAESISHA